jgi:hypothetical protein
VNTLMCADLYWSILVRERNKKTGYRLQGSGSSVKGKEPLGCGLWKREKGKGKRVVLLIIMNCEGLW